MNLERWGTCPQCVLHAEEKYRDLENLFLDAYGKVSEGRYREMYRGIEQGAQPPDQPSLLESYSIGICKGEFSVAYQASCEHCTFSHEYNHSEPLVDDSHDN